MRAPYFPLADVQALIRSGQRTFVWRKSVGIVEDNRGLTTKQAEEFIDQWLLKLNGAAFSATVYDEQARPADVYGIELERVPWYIKVKIINLTSNLSVTIISFHPAEFPLRTLGGLISKR